MAVTGSLALGGGSIFVPNYCPPDIVYKDADEIYLRPGRYYACGYRHRGQYQVFPDAEDYTTVAALEAHNIGSQAYSAGAQSGYHKAKVNSSWSSLFKIGAYVVALPYIRVDTIAFNTPTTDISPAAHADGTTAENGFITANDDYNDYRLVNLTDNAYDGLVYTIEDTVQGTPDYIKVTGDKTAEIAAAGWLQMIPPVATACVYLGSVLFDGSGNITAFTKRGWTTAWNAYVSVTGNKALSSSLVNTDMAAALPPVTNFINAFVYWGISAASNRGAIARFYSGSSGSNAVALGKWQETATNLTMLSSVVSTAIPITTPGLLRNHGVYVSTADVETAIDAGDDYQIRVSSWIE